MPDEAPKQPVPFDVRTVKSLVSLMTQHDLSEIDLRDGNQRLRLRRGNNQNVTVAAHPPLAHPVAPTPSSAVTRADSPASAPAPAAKALTEIKSPTVGTFYVAANPDSPPFVKVGTKVTPSTVVCVIEAMKIFNEIQAECSGMIVEILVENQQPVEYGQVLFRVDPTA